MLNLTNPARKVTAFIQSGGRQDASAEEPIVLGMSMAGYDGLQYRFAWQYQQSDAEPWQNAENGVRATLNIARTAANAGRLWRLAVTITGYADPDVHTDGQVVDVSNVVNIAHLAARETTSDAPVNKLADTDISVDDSAAETPVDETLADSYDEAEVEASADDLLALNDLTAEKPVDAAPADDAKDTEALLDDLPVSDDTAMDMPVEKAPADNLADTENLADDLSASEEPVVEPPAEEVPANDMVDNGNLADNLPVLYKPVEETSAEETVIGDQAAADNPQDDPSVLEEPVVESPAEEVPANDMVDNGNLTDNLPVLYKPVEETSAEETITGNQAAADNPQDVPSVLEGSVVESPAEEVPANDMVDNGNLTDNLPVLYKPVEEAPADDVVKAEIPADDSSVSEQLVADTLVDEAPADHQTDSENPADVPPVLDDPVADMPVEEKPADDAAVDTEAIADDSSSPDNLVEESPVEEAPAADTVVAEAPADESPVSDKPAGETSAEEVLPVDDPVDAEIPEDNPSSSDNLVEESSVEEAPANNLMDAEAPADAETSSKDLPVPDDSATDAPADDDPAGEAPAVEPDAPAAPVEDNKLLVSETEVDTYLVRFYDAEGLVWHSLSVTFGQAVPQPDTTPDAPEGLAFVHWYQVDRSQAGDETLAYDFSKPVTGLTYLKACYAGSDLPQEELPPQPEEPAEAQSLSFAVQAGLILEGAELFDGQFAALLTGPGLPAGGVEAVNQGDFFVFPALTFTREHLGVHTYRVQAVVREPQRGYVYDQVVHQAQVVISLDEAGQLTAALAAPVVIRHAYTPDHALVRVYADVQPGRLLAVGDSVRFTAEAVNCGLHPRFQWQFSADNANWQDIAGATGPQLDIILTPANAAGYWRVGVTITD
ncbi:MAG: hypothetical protein ACOX63_13605 [Christensenellales bacterium]